MGDKARQTRAVPSTAADPVRMSSTILPLVAAILFCDLCQNCIISPNIITPNDYAGMGRAVRQ